MLFRRGQAPYVIVFILSIPAPNLREVRKGIPMSDTVKEPARELAVIASAEVVVLGGGPAGVAAAIAAGRLGRDVLLVERYGCLGGLATGGLVIALDTYGPRGRVLMSGLAVEFRDRLYARNAAHNPETHSHESPVYDPEVLKHVALEMVEEARVRLLLHAWGVGAVVEDDRIAALIVESKSGRQAIRGQVFIDCSGDADLAAWAGVGHQISRSPLGLGLNARIGGVDYARFRRFQQEEPEQWTALRQEIVKSNFWVPSPGWRNDVVWLNTYFPGDALDVSHLTACEVELRKRIVRACEFYRARLPGFAQATLLDTASQVGTRESRRIEGEYTLTEADLTRAGSPDSIGVGVCWTGPHAAQAFAFPYRCLVPKRVDNLLFAGRCISADHQAHQNTRVIPNCIVTGQGAGTGAAVALATGRTPRRISVQELQRALRSQGVEV
mgnify:CR=1 FL=1